MKALRNILILLIGISGITLLPPFSILDLLRGNGGNNGTQPGFIDTTADEVKLTRLIETIDDLYLPSEKLELIENNPNLLPSKLSLGGLNTILDLFFLDSDKLKVTEIFQPRLKGNYSQSEFQKFRDHFFLDSDKLKAIRLINKN